jgi:ubiquinone/menaquinone biosynthesis C-methylase UbiE
MRPGGAVDAFIEFFNRRAVDYDREYAAETPGGYALRVRRRKVLDLFDKAGGTVLDVGCGPGVMVAELVERGCTFRGVDPSADMISIARERFPENDRVSFITGDAARLEFPDNSFDAVLCMGVMDFVPNGQQAIGEMIRVLKPGGTLIITVTNLFSAYSWWKNYVFYPLVDAYFDFRARMHDPATKSGSSGKLRRLYSRRQAEQLMTAAGGDVVRVVPYYFNVLISPLDELMPRIAVRTARRLEQWGRPRSQAGGWILQGRKRRLMESAQEPAGSAQ